jgi:hypothetical protein
MRYYRSLETNGDTRWYDDTVQETVSHSSLTGIVSVAPNRRGKEVSRQSKSVQEQFASAPAASRKIKAARPTFHKSRIYIAGSNSRFPDHTRSG